MSGKLQYTCLEDLNKAVTAKTTSGATSKMLLNSLGKLFEAAVNSEKQNNEEMAYILYMRFVQVVGNIRKTSDYKKDQKYFDNMINQQRVKQALAKAETISQSLELQYKKIEAKTAAAVRVKQITPPPKLENGTSKPDMMIMEPNDVIKLMSEKCTTFIIMDVRDSDEFRVSQIKHSNVMNVPGEILKPGVTAKNNERQLHIEQRGNWSRKGKMDKVILVDWTSESIPIGDDSSKLNVLKDALLKWDTDMVKCHKPIYMINGGFEKFWVTVSHVYD